MRSAKLPISRSACLMIRPGLSPTSFLESPIAGETFDLCSCSLSDATQKREGELWVSEKIELWVKEKKNEEGEVTKKNGLERDQVVMEQYRSCGLHEVFHFTELPLSLSLRNRKQHFLVSGFHHSHNPN